MIVRGARRSWSSSASPNSSRCAPSRGSRPARLADPVQPVAQGVPVHAELLGGRTRPAAGAQERPQRVEQARVVLQRPEQVPHERVGGQVVVDAGEHAGQPEPGDVLHPVGGGQGGRGRHRGLPDRRTERLGAARHPAAADHHLRPPAAPRGRRDALSVLRVGRLQDAVQRAVHRPTIGARSTPITSSASAQSARSGTRAGRRSRAPGRPTRRRTRARRAAGQPPRWCRGAPRRRPAARRPGRSAARARTAAGQFEAQSGQALLHQQPLRARPPGGRPPARAPPRPRHRPAPPRR